MSGTAAVVFNVALTKMTTDWFAGREIVTAMSILIASWPFGIALDAPSLFDAPQTFSLGGEEILALSPVGQFLHACYHAALGAREPTIVAPRASKACSIRQTTGATNSIS